MGEIGRIDERRIVLVYSLYVCILYCIVHVQMDGEYVRSFTSR